MVGEAAKADAAEATEQVRQAAKMMRRGGVAHPNPRRHPSQGQSLEPLLVKDLQRGIDQRLFEVARAWRLMMRLALIA